MLILPWRQKVSMIFEVSQNSRWHELELNTHASCVDGTHLIFYLHKAKDLIANVGKRWLEVSLFKFLSKKLNTKSSSKWSMRINQSGPHDSWPHVPEAASNSVIRDSMTSEYWPDVAVSSKITSVKISHFQFHVVIFEPLILQQSDFSDQWVWSVYVQVK